MDVDDKDLLPKRLPASDIPDNLDELIGGAENKPYTPFNETLDKDYLLKKFFLRKI